MPQNWLDGFRDAAQRIYSFVPALLGAAALVLAGWLIGRLLGWVTRRLITAITGRLSKHPTIGGALDSSGASVQIPRVISGFVFWFVFVFFIAAAMETLGLPVVTASLNRVAYYLPNVLAALLMIFAGVIVGKVVSNAVARTASGTGVSFGPVIGGTVRGTILLVAVVVAIEQVGIQADVLVIMVAIVVGTTLAGAALAFGLGARSAVGNIIASHYVAQAYRVGQTVRVGGVDGKIIQIAPTAVFVGTPEGRVLVPASHFNEMTSVLVTDAPA